MRKLVNALLELAVLVLCLSAMGCATMDHRAYALDGVLIVAESVGKSTSDLIACGPLSFKRLKELQAKGCYLHW